MHFAGRAAAHGEVLARQVHQAAADRRRAGDDAIGGELLAGHAERRGTVAGEQARLLEAPGIDTFEELRAPDGQPGLVDYVAERDNAFIAFSSDFPGKIIPASVLSPIALAMMPRRALSWVVRTLQGFSLLALR